MSESQKNQIEGSILQEFDVEGRPAAIVSLKGSDADTFENDLKEHAHNLAVNQESEETPHSGIKGVFQNLGSRFRKVLGKSINKDRSNVTKRIEHITESRKQHFQKMIREASDNKGHETELLGIYLDGKIVSVIGVKKMEQLPRSGRQIFEFTSGSTLREQEDGTPKYLKKGFSKTLRKTLYEKKMKEDPDAVWMSDSKNPILIGNDKVTPPIEGSWARWGWNITDIDDPNSEFTAIFRERNAEHLDTVYRAKGYKLATFDPKVDTLRW